MNEENLQDIPRYLPGFEPENIKHYLKIFFTDIDTFFPDKQIIWSEWKHDRWDNAANTLCKALGYRRGRDFLKAYGYSVVFIDTIDANDANDSKTNENNSDNEANLPISEDKRFSKTRCKQCGKMTPSDGKFCGYCGKRLNTVSDRIKSKIAKLISKNMEANRKAKINRAALNKVLSVIVFFYLQGEFSLYWEIIQYLIKLIQKTNTQKHMYQNPKTQNEKKLLLKYSLC